MSTIQRSKSAPQPLPALRSFSSTAAHLPRSASHQTIQPKANLASAGTVRPIPRGVSVTSPWREREDPFNLTGFFPTASRGETSNEDASWWLQETEEEEDEEQDEKRSVGVRPEGRTWSFVGEDAGTNRTAGQMSDEMTRETIKSEDKMGILSFGNLFARKDDGRHELLGTYSEPVDHAHESYEALYQSLCTRRTAQGIDTPAHPRKGTFGELFL